MREAGERKEEVDEKSGECVVKEGRKEEEERRERRVSRRSGTSF